MFCLDPLSSMGIEQVDVLSQYYKFNEKNNYKGSILSFQAMKSYYIAQQRINAERCKSFVYYRKHSHQENRSSTQTLTTPVRFICALQLLFQLHRKSSNSAPKLQTCTNKHATFYNAANTKGWHQLLLSVMKITI